MSNTAVAKKRGRPRKRIAEGDDLMPAMNEAFKEVGKSIPELQKAHESERPLGHYDKTRAVDGGVYQVVSHTRDAIKVMGPKGSTAAMIMRRSKADGSRGEMIDNPFAELAARELAEILNALVEGLR